MRYSALSIAVLALVIATPAAASYDSKYDSKHDRSDRSRSYSREYRTPLFDEDGGRRYDSTYIRYGESDGYYITNSLDHYFRTAPFNAARAELHPYFRNSPTRGYVAARQITSPAYLQYVQDQQLRQQLGLTGNVTRGPAAACRNYSVRTVNPRLPGIVESCN